MSHPVLEAANIRYICNNIASIILLVILLITSITATTSRNCDNKPATIVESQTRGSLWSPVNDNRLMKSNSVSRSRRYDGKSNIATKLNSSSSSSSFSNTFQYNGLSALDLTATETRKDICKQHCNCERGRNGLIIVTCDFQRNPMLSAIFDESYLVPTEVASVIIKLGRRTQFRLSRGFFSNNTIHHLTIEGKYMDGEQVEITNDAFTNNRNSYLQITFLNVFTVIIRSKAISGNCMFMVNNCNDLILYTDAFRNTEIDCLLIGIKDLRISEKAFDSADNKIRIESSNIENIYRFDALMNEVHFVNCTIGTVNAGTFDVIKTNSIIFEGCQIDIIKARFITEKLYCHHFAIMNSKVGLIESEAIYGSGITEMVLDNNTIDVIEENAIYATSINGTIIDNNIKRLGNNWLRMNGWSNIIIEGNSFGVFGGMILEDVSHPNKCRFSHNSLDNPLNGSLNITNLHCSFWNITINIPCYCKVDWLERLSARDLRSVVYCNLDDKLRNCFKTDRVNFLKYMNEVCDESKTILQCVDINNLRRVNGNFYTNEELENRNHRLPELIAILLGSILLLLLLTAIVILLVCHFRRSSSKVNCSSNASSPIRRHIHEFNQEDKLVIEQTLQLIQKKYPTIYKKIQKHIEYMMKADLEESKCIKCISQIVNLLDKVKSTDNDFIAFNRILTQHLQTTLPTIPPEDAQIPVYSEPTLGNTAGDFYTSTTFSYIPQTDTGATIQPTAGTADHIYAELNCAQQPLLHIEYSSPADRHMPSMDLYTEPIGEEIVASFTESGQTTNPACAANRILTQHKSAQYSIPKRMQERQESTARHFHTLNSPINPTGNSQNQPNDRTLTNVQKIAQNLQINPNFNPINKPRNLHLVTPPTYITNNLEDNSHQQQQQQRIRHLGVPVLNRIEMDRRGAHYLPSDIRSNHSGGSNETLQIDDIIPYIDA